MRVIMCFLQHLLMREASLELGGQLTIVCRLRLRRLDGCSQSCTRVRVPITFFRLLPQVELEGRRQPVVVVDGVAGCGAAVLLVLVSDAAAVAGVISLVLHRLIEQVRSVMMPLRCDIQR